VRGCHRSDWQISPGDDGVLVGPGIRELIAPWGFDGGKTIAHTEPMWSRHATPDDHVAVPGGGIAIKRQPVASESSLAPNLD